MEPRFTSAPSRAILTAVLLAVAGCAGKGALRPLPPHAGLQAGYRSPADSLVAASPDVLRTLGYRSLERADSDSSTVLLASKGPGLFSWGEALRVMVEAAPAPDASVVRVVGKPNYALDWSGRADRHAAELVRDLDARVGPLGVQPLPGDRVRGTLAGRGAVEGSVFVAPGSGLLLETSDGLMVPIIEVIDAEVFRGGWNQGRIGAAWGMSAGLLMALGAYSCGYSPFDAPCDTNALHVLLPVSVGTLVGWMIGRLVETEIWSPFDLRGG